MTVVRLMALVIALAAATAACGLAPRPSDCWVATRAEYRIVSRATEPPASAAVADVAQIIAGRLERHGLAEFAVETAAPDRLVVRLPAGADSPELRELIRATGRLEIVPIPDTEPVEKGQRLPSELPPLLGSHHVADATPSSTGNGIAALELRLTPVGGELLTDFTERNVGSRMALVLDGVVVSAPVIVAPITDGRLVVTPFEGAEAGRLAAFVAGGPLPNDLEESSVEAVERPAGCP